jgi:hypothetical protein
MTLLVLLTVNKCKSDTYSSIAYDNDVPVPVAARSKA